MDFKLVISALILNSQGELLLSLSRGRNIWTCLGGKAESNESDLECLIREVKEEAGIKLEDATFLLETPIELAAGNPNNSVKIRFYIVNKFQGELFINPSDEITELKWLSKKTFEEDVKISKKLEIGSGLEFYAIPELIKRDLLK